MKLFNWKLSGLRSSSLLPSEQQLSNHSHQQTANTQAVKTGYCDKISLIEAEFIIAMKTAGYLSEQDILSNNLQTKLDVASQLSNSELIGNTRKTA